MEQSDELTCLVVEDSQLFYTLHNPCRIPPELTGKRIRGSFHGWLILSNNTMWSLWNPLTSKIIRLPPLVLKDGDSESINGCCLSSPPADPSSVLLLTRADKPTFAFCRLDRNRKRKRLRWTEMSYAKQLKRITIDGDLLHSLACCDTDGKIFALNSDGPIGEMVIRVETLVKDRQVVINLVLFGFRPLPSSHRALRRNITFLKGSCTGLFYIHVGFIEETKETPDVVNLFKLDMTRINWEELERLKNWDVTGMILQEAVYDDFTDLDITTVMWEEMQDLKDAIFFVDLARDQSIFYNPAISSKFGGYIHIRDKIIYSYHVKDNTISLSSMPCPVLPTSHVSLWECRLQDDYSEQQENEIVVRSSVTTYDDEVELNESHLLNLPFHILEMVMKYSVGVEYMNFRATCKLCHQAAPLIKWSKETSLRRLETYSLVSPLLMVVNKNQGIISFTDPLLGDNYFMKNLDISIVDDKIYCSRFGWLLFKSRDYEGFVLFNPFTNDLRQLPRAGRYLESLCFSAPPTSPDCMVVGFTTRDEWHVHIHFVAREPIWYTFYLGDDPHSICFPTLYGRDLYALCKGKGGGLFAIKNLGQEDFSWDIFEAELPKSCCKSPRQYFLMKCDDLGLLLVIVGKFGEPVVVLRWNDSSEEWGEIDRLGKHMIYICDTTCFCIEAKLPEMENKIYFPRMRSKNSKIVFYSLETCTYHTYNGKDIEETFRDFFGTTHFLSPHTWIEPNWS